MKLQPLFWASTVLLRSACAVFTDEAFHVDYHHALLGVPLSQATFFHKPQSSSNASLIYTLSDKGILGAINPKDGTVLWRQVLNSGAANAGAQGLLAAGERDGQITSGYQNTVYCWDALDGKLKWEYKAEDTYTVAGVQLAPESASDPDSAAGCISGRHGKLRAVGDQAGWWFWPEKMGSCRFIGNKWVIGISGNLRKIGIPGREGAWHPSRQQGQGYCIRNGYWQGVNPLLSCCRLGLAHGRAERYLHLLRLPFPTFDRETVQEHQVQFLGQLQDQYCVFGRQRGDSSSYCALCLRTGSPTTFSHPCSWQFSPMGRGLSHRCEEWRGVQSIHSPSDRRREHVCGPERWCRELHR